MDSRYGAEQKSWLVGKVWSEWELSGKFSFNSSVIRSQVVEGGAKLAEG